MPSAWLSAALLLLLALCAMALLASPPTRRRLGPELRRKLLHIGIGLIAVGLPWLFDSPWPVLALAGAGLLTLLALRRSAWLERHLAAALGGRDRGLGGEVLFLLAVALLFLAARDRLVLYLVPLLVLTFADAAAALVGGRWGRHRFAFTGGAKSAEGSLAFIAVALFCAVPSLLLLTDLGLAGALLLALLLAATTALLELSPLKGADNFLIPLGAYLLLSITL